MNRFPIALLLSAIVATPATAESLSDTHVMRWAPAGKVPVVTYHPIKQACNEAAASHHISGKMQLRTHQPCKKSAQDIADAGKTASDNIVRPSREN